MFGGSTTAALASYNRFISDGDTSTLESVRRGAVDVAAERLATFELGNRRNVRALEHVAIELATELNVDHRLLASGSRNAALVRARLEIARRALAAGASLVSVAARLRRSASTLSEQLNRSRM
jgi:hypothetical protein